MRRDLADWSHREPVWCAAVVVLATLLLLAALGQALAGHWSDAFDDVGYVCLFLAIADGKLEVSRVKREARSAFADGASSVLAARLRQIRREFEDGTR